MLLRGATCTIKNPTAKRQISRRVETEHCLLLSSCRLPSKTTLGTQCCCISPYKTPNDPGYPQVYYVTGLHGYRGTHHEAEKVQVRCCHHRGGVKIKYRTCPAFGVADLMLYRHRGRSVRLTHTRTGSSWGREQKGDEQITGSYHPSAQTTADSARDVETCSIKLPIVRRRFAAEPTVPRHCLRRYAELRKISRSSAARFCNQTYLLVARSGSQLRLVSLHSFARALALEHSHGSLSHEATTGGPIACVHPAAK